MIRTFALALCVLSTAACGDLFGGPPEDTNNKTTPPKSTVTCGTRPHDSGKEAYRIKVFDDVAIIEIGDPHERLGAVEPNTWTQVAEGPFILDEGGNITIDAGAISLNAGQDIRNASLWLGLLTDGLRSVEAACWGATFAPRFFYHAQSGECRDAADNVGVNLLPMPLVREMKFGACVDFNGLDLHEGDVGGPILNGWDLRGASLAGATLSFADLTDAILEGANLDNFEFGYAKITGVVDAFTTLGSAESSCEVVGTTIECLR